MARSHNTYLAYKRDTNLLLYWVIRTSNQVINSKKYEHEPSIMLNTSGQTTVSGLLSMANLIARSMSGSLVPPAVYRLFQAVIKARTATWQAFQRVEPENVDPDIEKSNQTHKFFIDALQQAFEVLGGKQWESSQDGQRLDNGEDAEDEIKQSLFSNRFSKLEVNGGQDESSEKDPVSSAQAAPKQQQRRKTGKSKKMKGKKKMKKQQKSAPNGPDLEDVPLKDYRIIEDESGTATEYLMAVYALVKEWCDLRQYLSGTWMDVAYAGLNGATAGAVSSMAIAMLERSEFAIFLDFPGHESYETVMKTGLRGDPEKKDSMFSVAEWELESGGNRTEISGVKADMKELLLVHAYHDFMTFITDFQKNSNGKPTKALAKELGRWDPEFDLQKATKEERLRWRRVYTINWLYDLVNLFSAIVVQQNSEEGQNWDLAKVDWSVKGPWNRHRRLFGLNEFAGFVCSMAWQKQGTDISRRVMPHHVFQLQVIVDSLTVSRGWSVNALGGYVVREPASEFRPRRDVDRFLDRQCEDFGSGYLSAAFVLKLILRKKHDTNYGYAAHAEILEKQFQEFRDWLGESACLSSLKTFPPSRFSYTNSNGLWEYSPFLCGVGLMEGLEIAYRLGMAIWDVMPEPWLVIHLHNMLVQKGYIAEPVSLYQGLQHIFQEVLFNQGAVPTSNFAATLVTIVANSQEGRDTRRKKDQLPQLTRPESANIQAIMDLENNMTFTLKPSLILYREAGWNTERVSESEIRVGSLLGVMRLSQTKQSVDPATGKRRLEPTELVRRHLAAKVDGKPATSEESLIKVVDGFSKIARGLRHRWDVSQRVGPALPQLPGGLSGASEPRSRDRATGGGGPPEMRGSDLLEALKLDIHVDIAGDHPVSGVNYAWVTVRFMVLFNNIETELRKRRNPLYVRAFETESKRPPRLSLVYWAMLEENEECLRVMAEEFQNLRAGFAHHVYWDVTTMPPKWSDSESRDATDAGCTVM